MSGVIANEWIEPRGGAEKVLDAFAAMFPDAPIVCPWNDDPRRYELGRVYESLLGHTGLRHRKALAMPFMLASWRNVPIAEADWLLCASHLFAHHARLTGPARDVAKFVYVHSPARYLWAPELDPRGAGLPARAAAVPLRAIDRKRAQEAHRIASNSRFVAERVERCWGRQSTVIHPPVDVATFSDGTGPAAVPFTDAEQRILDRLPDVFVLGASRLVSYKRVDVAIAAGAAAGVPVVIAGDGPELDHLKAIAAQQSVPVIFVDRPSTALLRELYRRALAFVFAAVEDFGIMPVEAMATGTPAIVTSVGGTTETVVDGVTGVHLRSFEPDELRAAVEEAALLSPEACRARAWEFDSVSFEGRVRDWMTGFASPAPQARSAA